MMVGSKSTVEIADPTDTSDDKEPSLPLATVMVKRRQLELARINVVRQLGLAVAAPHREMLQRALQAVDQQLEKLI
jgi:hypothetical protein